MGLKETLKQILEREFGIINDEQLEEAFQKMDMSVYGIFTQRREKENEA